MFIPPQRGQIWRRKIRSKATLQIKIACKRTALHHPSLEGIGMPLFCAQESCQHNVVLNTKPNKMTVAILNLYRSFLSSSTY